MLLTLHGDGMLIQLNYFENVASDVHYQKHKLNPNIALSAEDSDELFVVMDLNPIQLRLNYRRCYYYLLIKKKKYKKMSQFNKI